MARKRAFAYRRCRRGTNCPLLPDAHKCSRVPNLGRHFSCELCDLHAHQTSLRCGPPGGHPGHSHNGGLCGRARRRPNGDAGLIADHLVRPARCFKRTSKGRGSTVHSHHAGLCPYPAHSSARHTSSQPTPGSPVGNSRGCRRHPPRHFAVGQDRQCQISLFRAVDAVDLTKPRPLLVGRPRARIHNDLVGGFSSPSRHVMHVPTGYAATGAMPSCSQEFATSHTVARCRSRFQRRSSN
jgi:hypothetical protein